MFFEGGTIYDDIVQVTDAYPHIQVSEALFYAPLVRSWRIRQPKRHTGVLIESIWPYCKCCARLMLFFNLYLAVSTVLTIEQKQRHVRRQQS